MVVAFYIQSNYQGWCHLQDPEQTPYAQDKSKKPAFLLWARTNEICSTWWSSIVYKEPVICPEPHPEMFLLESVYETTGSIFRSRPSIVQDQYFLLRQGGGGRGGSELLSGRCCSSILTWNEPLCALVSSIWFDTSDNKDEPSQIPVCPDEASWFSLLTGWRVGWWSFRAPSQHDKLDWCPRPDGLSSPQFLSMLILGEVPPSESFACDVHAIDGDMCDLGGAAAWEPS